MIILQQPRHLNKSHVSSVDVKWNTGWVIPKIGCPVGISDLTTLPLGGWMVNPQLVRIESWGTKVSFGFYSTFRYFSHSNCHQQKSALTNRFFSHHRHWWSTSDRPSPHKDCSVVNVVLAQARMWGTWSIHKEAPYILRSGLSAWWAPRSQKIASCKTRWNHDGHPHWWLSLAQYSKPTLQSSSISSYTSIGTRLVPLASPSSPIMHFLTQAIWGTSIEFNDAIALFLSIVAALNFFPSLPILQILLEVYFKKEWTKSEYFLWNCITLLIYYY